MKVAYFTNEEVQESKIQNIIQEDCEVLRITKRPDLEWVKGNSIDFLVSDRARYIVPSTVLDYLVGQAINCHTSFLPHNRGSLNILWATVLGVPYGVTIHKMTERYDEGGIIAQSALGLNPQYTLKRAYQILRLNMESLFETAWRSGQIADTLKSETCLLPNDPQNGSNQTVFQCEQAKKLLPNGWDTPLNYIVDQREQFLELLSIRTSSPESTKGFGSKEV